MNGAPFTPEQEARLREIFREELDGLARRLSEFNAIGNEWVLAMVEAANGTPIRTDGGDAK